MLGLLQCGQPPAEGLLLQCGQDVGLGLAPQFGQPPEEGLLLQCGQLGFAPVPINLSMV